MADFTPQFGDFNGDGRLDLVSGSNCCDPYHIHLFLRDANGLFGKRWLVSFKDPKPNKFARGTSRPYLLDWNRDGHTDLVVAYPGSWTLEVALGPLVGAKGISFLPTRSIKLPAIAGASPVHFSFVDWDGDGNTDLLVGVESGTTPSAYSIYWYRNTSAKGAPKFAKAVHLLDVPKPWELNAFTTVAWGGDKRPSLIVSVSKGLKLGEGGREWWPVESKLWLYRRK
jgi:hypothetical protein